MCDKCHHVFYVEAEFEQGFNIPKPSVCSSPEGCTSSKFLMLDEKGPNRCRDYQELRIQEQVSYLCREIFV